MKSELEIIPLPQDKFADAVSVVLKADLDSKEEIERHLRHLDAHYIAIDAKNIVGVIGWYQDNVKYATDALGDLFPGEEAYWIGFFAVEQKYRGQGIGSALLQKLEAVIKNLHQTALWVSSVPETKTYYETHGFFLIKEGYIWGNKKYFLRKSLE
ncbi:MAG: GNAT family N-acetyltransferase [Candidatus Levyibacteriota bacterium]